MGYKRIYNDYKGLELFLKHQLWIRLFVIYVWCLIMPIVAKMQGMYWTTTMIALYMIFARSSGLFVPVMRWMTLRQAYKSLIILDLIYILGTLAYYVDFTLFLYIEATLAVIFPILVEIFYINYNLYVVEKYGKDKFEEISYINSLTNAVGGALGFGTVILLDFLIGDTPKQIAVFIVLFVIFLSLQVANYRKYFLEMD